MNKLQFAVDTLQTIVLMSLAGMQPRRSGYIPLLLLFGVAAMLLAMWMVHP